MSDLAKELRDAKASWPKTMTELTKYIAWLVNLEHDYSSCAEATANAMLAVMNYMCSTLEMTNFQVSHAQLSALCKARGIKIGLQVLNMDDLLYPQYCNDGHLPGWRKQIDNMRQSLRLAAQDKLATVTECHPNVRRHWEALAADGPFRGPFNA